MPDVKINREFIRDALGLTEQQMRDGDRRLREAQQQEERRKAVAGNLNLPAGVRAYAASMRFADQSVTLPPPRTPAA